MENKALGKGLAALIPDKPELLKGQQVFFVRLELVQDNRFQPRINFDSEKFQDLVSSIKEKGVLQPILVRPFEKKEGYYEVIAGERRLKAARLLNFETIPVIVKNVSDQEALVIALIENIQREELNAIEEAEAYKRLMEEFHFSQEDVAQNVGKDSSTVSNLLRLLRLPEEIQKSVIAGKLSMGHARALVGVEEPSLQGRLFEMALKQGLSVRELENLIKGQGHAGIRRDREKIKMHKSQDILSLEDHLQKFLGTKVRIVPQRKRGKIVIDYYSSQDLDRIIRTMIK